MAGTRNANTASAASESGRQRNGKEPAEADENSVGEPRADDRVREERKGGQGSSAAPQKKRETYPTKSDHSSVCLI